MMMTDVIKHAACLKTERNEHAYQQSAFPLWAVGLLVSNRSRGPIPTISWTLELHPEYQDSIPTI